MFLISQNPDSKRVFEFFLQEMEVEIHSVFRFPLKNDFELLWTSAKTTDNLTVFKDGFVIGKTDFQQSFQTEPYERPEEMMPKKLHPLLISTVVRITQKGFEVQPGEQTGIFYSEKSISDFSLLIALLENRQPYLEAVGMLAATGYFLGNVTLFQGVQRISYLHKLEMPGCKEIGHSEFQPQKNNDDLMVQRFLEAIPENINTAISLSGGMDSRFVLGLLFKKGYKPLVYSRVCDEEGIIKSICDKTGLSVQFTNFPEMNDYTYTVRTDARIYHRGGNYYRMINDVKVDEFIFNGLSAEPALKHAYKSVWKNPFVPKRKLLSRLIDFGYLGEVGEVINGLKINKDALRSYYKTCLGYIGKGLKLKKKHEITRLYDHYNDCINWSHAHTADLTYNRYPLFLLAQKEAVELGIRSSFFAGLNDDRLRKLNNQIIPQCPVNYSNGRSFYAKPALYNTLYKIYLEYIQRFLVFLRYVKKRRQGTSKKYIKPEFKQSFQTSPGFLEYFDRDMAALQESADVTGNVKRAAITVNNVLKLHHKFKSLNKDL